jgi:predicted ribosome quality control (RQC) complex YloA/Tae2 family protein
MKELFINNIKCKIGNNAEENWKILDESKENYIFFHLSSFPSCYVILEIENEIKNIFELNKIIEQTALQCKLNTKYKNLKHIKVDYCPVSNVIKGDKIGEVYYKSNKKVKNIIV